MIQTLILYLISSILLCIILTNIEKILKENFYHSIIITQIYILILSGIFTTYHLTTNNRSIFLIVIFTFFIKIFYTYTIEETPKPENNINLKKEIINIIITYLINIIFINKVETVFLTTNEFKILIWISIVIYLYNNIKNLSKIEYYKNYSLKNKNGEYIVIEYAKLKNRYRNCFHTKYKELIPLIYTIMIYENYKRPIFLRKIDILLYKLDKEKRKFGIMQILSNHPITDEKSIILCIKKLENIYTNLPNKKDKSLEVLKKYYNKNLKEEILIIYEKIISH